MYIRRRQLILASIILVTLLSTTMFISQAQNLHHRDPSEKDGGFHIKSGPAVTGMRLDVQEYAKGILLKKVSDTLAIRGLFLFSDAGKPGIRGRIFISEWFSAQNKPVVFLTNIRGGTKFDLFVYQQEGIEMQDKALLLSDALRASLEEIDGVAIQ